MEFTFNIIRNTIESDKRFRRFYDEQQVKDHMNKNDITYASYVIGDFFVECRREKSDEAKENEVHNLMRIDKNSIPLPDNF